MSNTSSFSGDIYTLQEVAKLLGVTRERARQIEMQALKKLKQPKLRAEWESIIDSMRYINDSTQKAIS
ncbi:MAG: sigma factor-like helix-turn-helix DNA-binding protein [Sulfurimonas sp.]|nr:sigma factor-like helix-turn-helix DNA-binding protein [Sulfurimonas sp.]